MAESFEKQLAQVRGKIRRIEMGNYFKRKRTGLLYYLNCAEELNSGALLIWEHDQRLRKVFAMLAGLSIELLLKGIMIGLQEDFPAHHRLADLCDQAGITVDENDRLILQALSEHIYWASKYPAPLNEQQMERTREILEQQYRRSGNLANLHIPEKEIGLANYKRLWALFLDHFFQVQNVVIESAE
jgi:hypothetical protein